MKPRNKHEIRVHGLCATLPNLTDDHYDYAQKNCFDYHAAESRGFTFCLSCNHKWKRDFNSKGTCPSCEKKIYVLTYKETEYKSEGYMMILDIVEEFQVLRFIHIKRYSHKKKPPFYCHQEVVQKWINPEGRPVIFAKASGGFYADWQDSTDLSIKRVGLQVRQYSISPQAIYPVKKIIKKLKRNGLKSSLHRITPDLLFASLLTDSKSETLLKAKQYWMLSANVHNFRITHEWDSIKICLRNGYLIKDPGMWNDYIGLLRYFGKDLRSSKYVCPVDIQKEHDKLVEKKRNKDRKKKLERQREEVEVDQLVYEQEKGHFFGMKFTEGDISVKVMDHVQDFLIEGDILGHCLFASQYHKKIDSLLFSAYFKGELVESVEVSIYSMEISQARGQGNRASKHNKKIVELVNKNMIRIADRNLRKMPKMAKAV